MDDYISAGIDVFIRTLELFLLLLFSPIILAFWILGWIACNVFKYR